jgi:hypothetical protein
MRIPTSAFQFTDKTLKEINEAKKRIEEFRKIMIDQVKVNLELLLMEITI